MLSLAEQVRRDPGRVRRAVGDDEDLAGPGDHVDIDKAEDLPLGFRDKGIAGANDLIDLRDRLRAISQGSDGLGAAGLEDPIHPGDLRRRQNDRRDTAAAGGGRDHDDLAAACQFSRDGIHQDRRGIGRCAAGDIQADFFDGRDLLAHDNAVPAGKLKAGAALVGVEGADVLCGLLHHAAQLWVDGL